MISISIVQSEFPLHLRQECVSRVLNRGGEPEVVFDWRASNRVLPCWYRGELRLIPWGSSDRRGRLPQGPWTQAESIRLGKWGFVHHEVVQVACNLFRLNGVWTMAFDGVRGLVAETQTGPVAYLVCIPTQRYYRTLLGQSDWMPLLCNSTGDLWAGRTSVL